MPKPAPAIPVPAVVAHPVAPAPAVARRAGMAPAGVRPELFRRAVAALDRHSMSIASHDRIAIADFSVSSSLPRFFLINMGNGQVESLLVSHGSGSDPAHTGWLQRFSNDPGSNATCEGAFVTSDYYFGKHGASQRLIGLDATNNNALDRAIVVHGAKYATAEHMATYGKLGRSQGCFAVGPNELDMVFLRLGPGRLIFSAKV
ncbi:murein L,D-transpeptidase catalytic domain family protein [Sphingomonas canadensis]